MESHIGVGRLCLVARQARHADIAALAVVPRAFLAVEGNVDLYPVIRRARGRHRCLRISALPGAALDDRHRGAELRYLPSYSPDFNPIEQFFAKLKSLLRKVAARTIEALIAAIAEALTKVSPQECENYLTSQGYRRQL